MNDTLTTSLHNKPTMIPSLTLPQGKYISCAHAHPPSCYLPLIVLLLIDTPDDNPIVTAMAQNFTILFNRLQGTITTTLILLMH